MNNEMLKGSWNQVKGGVKEAFGKLTDNDLLQLEGSLDRANGILQERYGYSKERAQQEWDTFLSRYDRATRSVRDSTDNYRRDVQNSTSNKLDQLRDKGSQKVKEAADSLKGTVDSAKEKMKA